MKATKVVFTYKALPNKMVGWRKHIGDGHFTKGAQQRTTTLVEFARAVIAAADTYGEENVYATGVKRKK